MSGNNAHIKVWHLPGLLLCICLLVCFGYGMHKAYQAMLPKEVYIRYADLEPLPRGLSAIDKLLGDRLTDSLPTPPKKEKQAKKPSVLKDFRCKSLVVYRYDGHTLYEVVRGNDSLTITAHITDTMPPVYVAPPSVITAWSDSLLQGTMPLERYVLDYRRIIARYDGQVSRIEWNSFDTIPLYIISLEGHDEPVYINASTPYVKPFYLTEEVVTGAIKDFCQVDTVNTELMTEYDNYYVDWQRYEPLPVWKVSALPYTLYINPRTGAFVRYNTSSWWHYLRHHAFNALRYKLFAKHPERWEPTMWGVLAAGLLLSIIAIIQNIKRLKNKNKEL